MSKVEVDLNQLAAAVSAAILQFAKPAETDLPKLEPEHIVETPLDFSEKPKKKRGRPKKQKPVETIVPEDIEPGPSWAVEEEEESQPRSEFTAPAKRSDFTIQHDPDKKMAKRVPFKKRRRVNQWSDDLSLAASAMYNDKGEKIIYPPHTPPREAQEEKEYKCDNCQRKFMAFPSYIPSMIEGHQPAIRCYNCNTK